MASLSRDRLRPQDPGQQSHVDPGRLTAWAPQSARLGPRQLGPRQQCALPPQVLGCGHFPGLLDGTRGGMWAVGSSLLMPRRPPLAMPGNPRALWGLAVPGHVAITWFSPSWAPPHSLLPPSPSPPGPGPGPGPSPPWFCPHRHKEGRQRRLRGGDVKRSGRITPSGNTDRTCCQDPGEHLG